MQRHGKSTTMSEFSPLTGGESSLPLSKAGHTARSEWWHSSFLIMAEVMGMGVLGLPHAMAQVGWVVGIISCLLFGGFAFYSALLLASVKNECFPNQAELSYGDVAQLTFGPAFASFTRAAVHATWASILPFFLLACAESVATLAPAGTMHSYQWTLLVALLLVGPLQLRTLHDVSWLSLVSSVAVIVAVVAIILALLFQPMGHVNNVHASGANGMVVHTDQGVMAYTHENGSTSAGVPAPLALAAEAASSVHRHSVWLPEGSALVDVFGHVSAFVFAYGGHSVMFEIMSESAHARGGIERRPFDAVHAHDARSFRPRARHRRILCSCALGSARAIDLCASRLRRKWRRDRYVPGHVYLGLCGIWQ